MKDVAIRFATAILLQAIFKAIFGVNSVGPKSGKPFSWFQKPDMQKGSFLSFIQSFLMKTIKGY